MLETHFSTNLYQ